MSWRPFAVGLIGGFVLATLLELPLQWYLPGRFVDGWPSIDRTLAVALSVGSMLLVFACGALAAWLDRATSRRQAISTGAVAGLIAALVADALVGAAAAALWGWREVLSRGLPAAADLADWYRLAHASTLGTYNWTYASLWIAAALGLGAGALGGALITPQASGRNEQQLQWAPILLVCLVACGLSLSAVILEEIGLLLQAIQNADTSALPIPCAGFASTTTLLLATGFGMFLVLQLLSLHALGAMPRVGAADHAVWRLVSLAVGATTVVLLILVTAAFSVVSQTEYGSANAACVTTPLSRSLFLGIAATLGIGAFTLARVMRTKPSIDSEHIARVPSRRRYFSTVVVGGVSSGLIIWLLFFGVYSSFKHLSSALVLRMAPLVTLTSSASEAIWEIVIAHFKTQRLGALMCILFGLGISVLVADSIWIVEWHAQRRVDRSSAARPMRMITSLLRLSLSSLLIVAAICSLLAAAWATVAGWSGMAPVAPQWRWTTIVAPPMIVALFVVTVLALDVATRWMNKSRRRGALGYFRGLLGTLFAIVAGVSLWLLPTIGVSWAARRPACENVASLVGAWEDKDADGVQDPGEPPIPYIALTWDFPLSELPTTTSLTRADGQSEHVYPACATDQVTIRAYTPSGYQPTTPTFQTPTSPGADVRFGFRRTLPETADPAWYRSVGVDHLRDAVVRYPGNGFVQLDLGSRHPSAAWDLASRLRDVISLKSNPVPRSGYLIDYVDRGRSWRICYPSSQCILTRSQASSSELAPSPFSGTGSSPPALEVVTNVGTVLFPDEISLDLSLNVGDAEVRSVWLEYGLPDATCIQDQGAESVAFTHEMQDVSAEWNWRDWPGSGGVMPMPGMRLWWRWLVDTDLGQTATPLRWLVWLDADQDWVSLSSEALTVHWQGGDLGLAESVAEAALDARSAAETELRAQSQSELHFFIYGPNDSMYRALSAFGVPARALSNRFTGSAFLNAGGGDLAWARRAAAHETTHLVLNSLSCDGFPAWLDEGLAMRAEGQPSAYFLAALDHAVKDRSLFTIQDLTDSFRSIDDPDRQDVAYAQAHSLVTYLIDTYGIDKMADLVHAHMEGSWTDNALFDVYGFGMDGLESEWRASIGAAEPR